jgi:hypothetical protein
VYLLPWFLDNELGPICGLHFSYIPYRPKEFGAVVTIGGEG